MKLLRKFVRFYENNPENMRIYDAVCNYKSYGFRSESDMILEALRKYLSGGIINLSLEEFADLIADRLQSKITVSSTVINEANNSDVHSDEEVYDTALSFLDSL